MKDLGCFGWVVMILAIITSLAVGKWFYELVIGSNLPEWLKYIILR